MKNKGVLPEKDMRKMSGREYVNWLTDYLVYEDEEQPVRKLTEKEKQHLAQYSGAELMPQWYDAPQPTAQQGDGSGWMLFFIFFIVGMTLLLAAGMGWL